jgi:hypothetical protein
MGPWASAIVAVAAVVATFITVMAFRGLLDALEGLASRCAGCGKTTLLPLPVQPHQCWHCRHPHAHLPRRHLPHVAGH